VLSFQVQVGPASIALLVLGAWFVVTGFLGGRSGVLPRGGRMGLFSATYVGYPIWASGSAGTSCERLVEASIPTRRSATCLLEPEATNDE
jgi:hypothetical protein